MTPKGQKIGIKLLGCPFQFPLLDVQNTCCRVSRMHSISNASLFLLVISSFVHNIMGPNSFLYFTFTFFYEKHVANYGGKVRESKHI